MSRVIVTQQPLLRDPETGAWRPKFDLSPAMEYGEVSFIFGAGQVGMMREAVVDAIEAALDEHDYNASEDYLLATGDMVLGMQTALCMMRRGGCRALRWDGKFKRYFVYQLEG